MLHSMVRCLAQNISALAKETSTSGHRLTIIGRLDSSGSREQFFTAHYSVALGSYPLVEVIWNIAPGPWASPFALIRCSFTVREHYNGVGPGAPTGQERIQ